MIDGKWKEFWIPVKKEFRIPDTTWHSENIDEFALEIAKRHTRAFRDESERIRQEVEAKLSEPSAAALDGGTESREMPEGLNKKDKGKSAGEDAEDEQNINLDGGA